MPSKFLSDSAPDAAPAPVVEPVTPASTESTKIHAALTRSSTGSADLRELESGLDSLQSDAARKARVDWSRVLLPIAALLAQVAPLRRAFGPLISGLQVLPSVALVPAAIIWFGLTDATVYFVVFMGAIPSIINGLISGVDQIPPQYRRVGTVLGASRLQTAVQIIL